ncbi:putative 8-amino-7-oxononanoate synthase [Bordetella pertussis STO1-CHOC-0017]|nr:hypothetical protein L565_2327 [Bordetella pertussis CHLA-20]ETH81818.1 putative 8-amino-7-oxononanoate synthase [Bordetella pertussis STO1-CHOC-0017]
MPAGTSRLRIALSAAHGEAELDQLIEALAAGWRAVRQAA